MRAHTDGLARSGFGTKNLLAFAAAALLALALTFTVLPTPASTSPSGPGVRFGKNVTVFHNSDFVAVYGYRAGDRISIDVFRGSHRIATAFGPAVNTADGAGLEVNHGPLGAAGQGDCWERFTPDILPGDRIVVTDPTGTDEVIVDGITIDSGPTEVPNDPNNPPPDGLQAGDVVLEGRAVLNDGTPNGTPIDVAQLEVSSEFRQDEPRLLVAPTEIVATDADGGWRAIYRQPYNILRNRGGLDPAQQKQALLRDGNNHSIGYGHVVPTPAETQLAETAAGGPALGCDVPTSPFFAPRQANALATSSDPAINLTSGPITFGGTAAEEVESITLTLSDGTTTVTAADVGITAGPGNRGWSGEFTREQLDSLAESRDGGGPLTARAVFNLPGGGTAGESTMRIVKDTAPPGLPTATPGSGAYNVTRFVALSPPAGETEASIRYTTGAAPEDPTETVGQAYRATIQVAESQKVKARVFDAAGNAGDVATFDYTIDRNAPTLTASLASGSYDGARSVALSADDPDAALFYTTNGATPTTSSVRYSGAIPVNRTMTLRAVAIDPAGNSSPVLSRTYTIRAATSTSLAMSTRAVKLRATKVISGAVSPANAGRTVKLTIVRPGADLVRNVPLVNGRYSYTYKATVVGPHSVKASFLQDADNLGSTSAARSFRVIR